MNRQRSVLLASASPRRQLLLREAGLNVQVHPPDIDDGQLQCGKVDPQQWVMALAYLKARRVLEMLGGRSSGIVIGADTVCVHEGRILGQPVDVNHARWMLMLMRDAAHVTMTGACILKHGQRFLLFDCAEVHLGELSEQQVDAYLESGNWRGKAGGYNLTERIAAGWPVRCVGDPTTVMGLPMRKLEPMLRLLRCSDG